MKLEISDHHFNSIMFALQGQQALLQDAIQSLTAQAQAHLRAQSEAAAPTVTGDAVSATSPAPAQ